MPGSRRCSARIAACVGRDGETVPVLSAWDLRIHTDVEALARHPIAHILPKASNLVGRPLSVEPVSLCVCPCDQLRIGEVGTREPVGAGRGRATWEEAVHPLEGIGIGCPSVEAIGQMRPYPLERHVLVRWWDGRLHTRRAGRRVIFVTGHHKDGVEDELSSKA
jgi:hypothetical protein